MRTGAILRPAPLRACHTYARNAAIAVRSTLKQARALITAAAELPQVLALKADTAMVEDRLRDKVGARPP